MTPNNELHGGVAEEMRRDDLVENCEMRLNHGAGLSLRGDRSKAFYNNMHHNGQIGLLVGSAFGDEIVDVRIENNTIESNNYAGYSWWWEAGILPCTELPSYMIRPPALFRIRSTA